MRWEGKEGKICIACKDQKFKRGYAITSSRG